MVIELLQLHLGTYCALFLRCRHETTQPISISVHTHVPLELMSGIYNGCGHFKLCRFCVIDNFK